MKKWAFLLLPLMIISCNKEASAKENNQDSTAISEPVKISEIDSSVIKQDSANEAILDSTVAKKEGETVKIIDGQKLPFSIEQKFDDNIQKLIIKIPYYDQSSLKAVITPENNKMNVRFNQIKTPDGKFDGPFGREISYKIPKSGEVWLIVGKNLMAEGELKGTFSVTVE